MNNAQYGIRYVKLGMVYESTFQFTSLQKASEHLGSFLANFKVDKKASATKLHDHAMKFGSGITPSGRMVNVWIYRLDNAPKDRWWTLNNFTLYPPVTDNLIAR